MSIFHQYFDAVFVVFAICYVFAIQWRDRRFKQDGCFPDQHNFVALQFERLSNIATLVCCDCGKVILVKQHHIQMMNEDSR